MRDAAARAALVFSVAFVLFSSGSASSQAKPDPRYTVLSGSGQTLYRIAIAPVIDKGGAASAARQATKVLTRDLTLCGMFKVLDPKGFLANLKREGVGIDPTPWQNVGAQGVIKARVQPFGGRRFAIDFFLYDTTKGTRPVLVAITSTNRANQGTPNNAHGPNLRQLTPFVDSLPLPAPCLSRGSITA